MRRGLPPPCRVFHSFQRRGGSLPLVVFVFNDEEGRTPPRCIFPSFSMTRRGETPFPSFSMTRRGLPPHHVFLSFSMTRRQFAPRRRIFPSFSTTRRGEAPPCFVFPSFSMTRRGLPFAPSLPCFSFIFNDEEVFAPSLSSQEFRRGVTNNNKGRGWAVVPRP